MVLRIRPEPGKPGGLCGSWGCPGGCCHLPILSAGCSAHTVVGNLLSREALLAPSNMEACSFRPLLADLPIPQPTTRPYNRRKGLYNSPSDEAARARAALVQLVTDTVNDGAAPRARSARVYERAAEGALSDCRDTNNSASMRATTATMYTEKGKRLQVTSFAESTRIAAVPPHIPGAACKNQHTHG
jgi:hypothetical protein